MAECLFATGIPFIGRGDADDHATFQKELGAVMGAASGIRRMGSAALDLAWVAAGRMDGFWERGLNIWDIAAGVIIVREAGDWFRISPLKIKCLFRAILLQRTANAMAICLNCLGGANSPHGQPTAMTLNYGKADTRLITRHARLSL